jgi:predicted DNA binding CopG/RHH family protein
MAKSRLKQVVIPKFSSETEEAAWWDSHRSEIEEEIRKRMKQDRPLTLGNLLHGAKPSQPVTLRMPKEDLETARRLAAQKGLGYQTYIKMLLRDALPEDLSESLGNLCSLTEIESGFEYWSRKKYLSEETRTAIGKSDIVLVPAEGYGDYAGPVFPVGTNELFQFLRSNVPSRMSVELATEDVNYAELALHGDVLYVANILVTVLGAPVATELIVEYLRKHLGSRLDDTEVRASMILDRSNGPDSKTIRISYEGPARAFEKTMHEAMSYISGTYPSRAEMVGRNTHSRPLGRRK